MGLGYAMVGLFGRRRLTPRLPPLAARQAVLPERDAPPPAVSGELLADDLATLVALDYADAAGGISRRRPITIQTIHRAALDDIITGWCHIRQQQRTFLASRTRRLVDLRTNEVSDTAQLFFRRALMIGDPGARATVEAIQRCHAGLVVMAAVGAKYGLFEEREREIVCDWIQSRSPNQAVDRARLSAYVGRVTCDAEAVDRALSRLGRMPDADVVSMAQAIGRIIMADRQVDADEQEIFDRLRAGLVAGGHKLEI